MPLVSPRGQRRYRRSAPKRPPGPGGLPKSVRINGVRTSEPEPKVPLAPSLGPDHPIRGTMKRPARKTEFAPLDHKNPTRPYELGKRFRKVTDNSTAYRVAAIPDDATAKTSFT
ncbi:hypothetical protein EVAR_74274_1 [Eumeta japonica]|uniref:Uncharacterized protein n=1 Tax=Eumeta variegata TaxID=151549 RepID=A0A4C1SCT2_EUMVA|nr:hypothetical protein EVAR_74274_1 [Eumeta japonica]